MTTHAEAMTPNRSASYLEGAIAEADRIRREHNGIGGVYLYLGHDGDNACEFRDFDGKLLAKATSGRTLFDAVQQCETEWRTQKWVKNLASLIRGAAHRRGHDRRDRFTVDDLQLEIAGVHGVTPTENELTVALSKRVDLVRVSCAGWFILPDGMYRYT